MPFFSLAASKHIVSSSVLLLKVLHIVGVVIVVGFEDVVGCRSCNPIKCLLIATAFVLHTAGNCLHSAHSKIHRQLLNDSTFQLKEFNTSEK